MGKPIDVFGLPLAPVQSLEQASSLVDAALRSDPPQAYLATFSNPLGLRLLKTDENYLKNLRRMDAVFCDGIALALASRWLEHFPIERISFDSTSLAPRVFELARRYEKGIAVVGGRSGVADVAAARIQETYPGISILGTFNGYIPQDALVGAVRALNPPVVLCGMGVPRQEAFLVALADAGWIGAGFTCGGYLDHLSERFNFYPAIINRLNLRWLYRLAREPRRIGYRCVVEYAPFWRTATWKLVQTILHMPSRGQG